MSPTSLLTDQTVRQVREEPSASAVPGKGYISMQHSQRLDQKLYTLREEVRTMSREKEQVEKVWRERLQRCQRQLQAKEDENILQSQYFESFKSQLQHKLKQSRDREETLQNRIYTLEKQLLDMTVTAATGIATMGPVRITSGTATDWEEPDRLPSLRGEGEGEEAKKEERKKQWPNGLGGDRTKDSNETRLQGFILSLQEDLRVLLEREEKAMTEQRVLMEQLHEAQEGGHVLGCKVEEMKSEIHQLNLSKVSLEEEVDELREDNQRLQQSLQDAANNLPNTADVDTQKAHIIDEENPDLSAVPLNHHQATPVSSQSGQEDPLLAAKSETSFLTKNGPQTLFGNFGSKTNQSSFQSLTLTTETIDELRMGTWCYNGVLNLEEGPGEDTDALREAYRSLALVEDVDFIKEQRDRFEEALQLATQQLKIAVQENALLKSQIKQQEETGLEQYSSKDMLCEYQLSTMEDSTIISVGSDDLIQALNEENRALAGRIQELQAHIELREEEIQKEQLQIKERICRLEISEARQQQENNEQVCLITELTQKTEDDLNSIMELQQKLAEYQQLKEEAKRKKLYGFQSKHTQTVFRKEHLDECVDMLVNCVIESDKEPQFISNDVQESVNESSQNMPCSKSSDNLNCSLKNEEVDQLTKVIDNLKKEQEELTGRIKCQKLQQKEVALSIQKQTEEKQRLTREVWGLKEEKDHIFKSLVSLKQERELLTKTVCTLKDERDQFQRSMTGLKEEKQQLDKSLPKLKQEKDALLESISNGVNERNQTLQLIQNLQNESLLLNQAVLHLKQERDGLTHSVSLEERRDKEQSYNNLQEDCAKLQKKISILKEEQVRIEFSISRLKQEENQMMLLLQGLQGEYSRLQTRSPSQTQTRERVPPYPGDARMGGTEYEQQHESVRQDQNDLMMQIETLGVELQKSHEELQQTQAEMKRLQSELFQSEIKREEAERRASQSTDKLLRLTDVSNQLDETRNENDQLKSQFRELQSKTTGMTREKNEALSLKSQLLEQYNILTAQLKAKSVALDELNSEYISLKQSQNTKEDLRTAFVSLQDRYNDIRTKYDTLLYKKSRVDMDIAPLKAKLSCLVVKCQERNNMLVQMIKVMQKHGCVDYILKQQVEQLLSDSALQSYASTFTTGSGFTPEIMITFEDSNRFTEDCHSVVTTPSRSQQGEFSPERKRLGGDKSPSLLSTISTTPYDCTSRKSLESVPTLHRKNISPMSTSPTLEHREVLGSASPAISQRESTHTPQLSPSPRVSVHKTSGLQQLNVKAESSPDLTQLTESSGFFSCTGSSSSLTCFGSSKRLSSPEKIMSLQEQLQKTLHSSFQAPAGRERRQQPRKYLSFSAQSLALSPAPHIQKPNLSVYNSTISPPPVMASSSNALLTSGGTTKPTASNKPTTLFNAVGSRSATVTFSPAAQKFTSKAKVSGVSSDLSSSSSPYNASTVPSKAQLTTGANKPISPKLKNTLTMDVSDAAQKDSLLQNISSPVAMDSVSKCSDTPQSTASDTTSPSRSNSFNMISKMDSSSKHTSTPARKAPGSTEKAKTPTRIKEEAPAEVRSIEVIKTVGLSSLLIGWERPPLDELGCSNGTFVYGYRVFVDGVFHKSVMSSACTKCILENVNLSVPIHITVQTLGSNGLSSNSVNTTYSLAKSVVQ